MLGTPPTSDELVEFFGALTQLRTIYGRVDVIFRGNNTMPEVTVYWPSTPAAAQTVRGATDTAADLIASVEQLYTDSVTEGQLRQQLAALLQQVAETKAQLGIA